MQTATLTVSWNLTYLFVIHTKKKKRANFVGNSLTQN